MKKISILPFSLLFLFVCQSAFSSEPISLKSQFDIEQVKWVKEKGDAVVTGSASITLKDKTIKGCAGFGVELLPVADYSNERIVKTYGNNKKGQVLLEDNPPKFTPDVKEYHELVLKASCNDKNEFYFDSVPAGHYYAIAFIIWDVEKSANVKAGGAVMQRIEVKKNSKNKIRLSI